MKEIYAKSIINKHRRRDSWFLDDYSLNPYQLCEFNCLFCYIRGSKYGGNLVRELAVKVNAPTLTRRELAKLAERRDYGFIALSSATEPWMHLEERYQVTRRCLEAILKYRFPVHCLTKSPLILRDLDLLEQIERAAVLPPDLRRLGHGMLITISLSTLDERLASIFEPNAPKPKERLGLLQKLREAGFHAGVAYIPVLPFLSDTDEQLEEMVKAAKEFQASYLFVGALTLEGAGRELYFKALEKYFPELLPQYEQLYRFSQPSGSYQDRLHRKVKELCVKLGVKYHIL